MHTSCRNSVCALDTGKQSGDAFMSQGVVLEKAAERDEAATCYINAGKSYKKEHPKGCPRVMQKPLAH